jgi:peptidoglycan/LPS O-acetylase OafA/YrhL
MTKYRPEIDGLRTIAVLAVILFHLNSNFLIGGYYGVDVFFVISGYLIIGILIRDIRNNNFKMSKFWIRRVKRILPLLLTVIITTTLVLPFVIFRPTFNDTLNDIIPSIFSYFNFHAFFNFGDYWRHQATHSFFLHTWSLSIEEQFYIIFPLLLFILNKYFKFFLVPLIIITFISLGLFIYFVYRKPELTFYMLPFRIWELSIGGIIACLPLSMKRHKKLGSLFPILGLALIFISFIFASKNISRIAILPVIGSFLIIYYGGKKDITGRLLSSPIFVHLGKLSYSLYLWHWPIIVLFNNLQFKFIGISKFYIYLTLVLITYILSFLSYKLIETKLRYNPKTPKIVLMGIGLCVLLIAFFKFSNFNIYYHSLYHQQTNYLEYYDVTPKQSLLEKENPLIYNVILPKRMESYNDAYKSQGIVNLVNNNYPKVLVLGDSHGVMWAKTLQEATEELQLSSSIYTTDASRPFFNIKDLENQNGNLYFTKKERIDYAKSVISNINRWKIKILIIACRWETFTDNDKVHFEDLIVYLKEENIKILVMNQPPQISIMEDCNAVQFISYLRINPTKGFNTISLSQEKIIKSNKYLVDLSHKYSNIIVFDVFKRLYSNNHAKITYNKDVLYFDDDHLSYSCTQLFKEDLKNVLKNCVN